MRVLRPLVAVVGLVAIGLAPGARAAAPAGPSSLTFDDPAGDAVATDPGNDIVSVTYATSGVLDPKGPGKGRGKGNLAYTPKALVVTLKLAAPPSAVPGTLYELDADTSGCGALDLYFTPGIDGSGGFVDCGSAPDATGSTATNFDVEPKVAGNTVTWTLPLSSLPKEMAVGSTISAFAAYSTQTDPATGLVGPYLLTDALNYDNATSDASYKIG